MPLETNTTYVFQRDGDNKTTSLTGTVKIYDTDPIYKTIYYRPMYGGVVLLEDGESCLLEDGNKEQTEELDFTNNSVFESVEVVDFAAMTSIETTTFDYNILSAQQTTANPVDRSGTTPEPNGDYESKLGQIKALLVSESVYTTAVSFLWDKHAVFNRV